MEINQAFTILMKQENPAIVNVSGDRGGVTKYGIAEASHPGVDVVNLTEVKAISIYTSEYWLPAKCDQLKSELQYIHFSCAVNCGVGSANKILQRACRVTDDGIVGPATLEATKGLSIQDYAIEWAAHYRAIVEADHNQAKFLKGWMNRIDYIMQLFKSNSL